MSTINVYLTFNGNCREAMKFYQKCLGGKLSFQEVGGCPLSEKMPERMKNCIMHATLSNGPLLLTGTDMAPENGLLRGNAVTLALDCSSEKEIRSFYKKLSKDGEQTQPLEKTFWGALFGCLSDKYGINWILNFARRTQNL